MESVEEIVKKAEQFNEEAEKRIPMNYEGATYYQLRAIYEQNRAMIILLELELNHCQQYLETMTEQNVIIIEQNREIVSALDLLNHYQQHL